ncbi:hypothetical protein [Bradyrhizobium diazoefficiens]|uniref:hypothetical protein n=1 Tax=Bradyrhizobium diazoefficiens TaxID=1355477 RepID=UPI003515D898
MTDLPHRRPAKAGDVISVVSQGNQDQFGVRVIPKLAVESPGDGFNAHSAPLGSSFDADAEQTGERISSKNLFRTCGEAQFQIQRRA